MAGTWSKGDIKPDNLRVNAEGNVIIINTNVTKPVCKCTSVKVVWGHTTAGTPRFVDPGGVYGWSPDAEVWRVGLMLKACTLLPHRICAVCYCTCAFGSHVPCVHSVQLPYLNKTSPLPTSLTCCTA